MNETKELFKQWLIEQKVPQEASRYRQKTINGYIKTIDQICQRSFSNNDENAWEKLKQNIYPQLTRCYELSNKDYFLDKISIKYALFYFQKISSFIYSEINKEKENNVKLYLNFDQKDYMIREIKLDDIFRYVILFDTFVFRRKHTDFRLNPYDKEAFFDNIERVFTDHILSQIDNNHEIKHRVMLHISYGKQNQRKEKDTLLKYHSFLHPKQNVLDNSVLFMVKNQNPYNKVGENYIVDCDISGNNPLHLDINPNNNLFGFDDYADKNATDEDERYIIIKNDMPKIFNVAYNSIDEIISKGHFKTFQGPTRLYYDIDSVNSFLQKKFHPLKEDDKHKNVDYDEAGYEFWCSRSYALREILKISHNRFYDCVHRGNCTQLDYLENKPKYYIPDLEYLRQSHGVKQARISMSKYKK